MDNGALWISICIDDPRGPRYLDIVRTHRIAIAALAVGTALCLAAPAQADVVPRDGTYGGMNLTTGAMGMFVMRNQIVAGVEYQIPITCIDSDGNTSQDAFKGGGTFPPNTRLNANLTLRNTYMESDEGLSGRRLGVQVTISFQGRRPTMQVWVNRVGDIPCDGSATIPLARGPLPSSNQCTYNAASKTFTCDRPIPPRGPLP